MVAPLLPSRMKEIDRASGLGIERVGLVGFKVIAVDARQGQVLFVVSAAMFARDDVFDLQLSDWRESLRQVAVFAAIGCSVTNELA
jgi:hypothetical protein